MRPSFDKLVVTICAALALTFGATTAAPAQALQRLTVGQFTLAADEPAPKLEQPFHLIVTVRVKQKVGALENLDLPILAELELLGDERRITRDATGTTYRENITVVAHHTGAIHIAPATLDAVDARDGKAKRYFSNDLTLEVTGGALQPLREAGSAAGAMLRAALSIAFWIVCLAAAAFVAVTIFRRRRAVPVAIAAPLDDPPPAPAVRDDRDLLHDGLLALRAERSRAAAVAVRALVREMVGASQTETLSYVLRRPGAQKPRMRSLLVALERAAFTYDNDLPAAIDDAIAALEHALE